MHQPLTPAALAELRRPRKYPAVSVLLPTHRREPDNAQDSVRLRNLLEEAKNAVHHDPEVSRTDRIDVIGQLDQAGGEVDLTYAEDGLAIFAAPGEHHVWSLDRSVPPRVLLAQTFLTRNLVAAHAANQPFWALAVSADVATMWSGGRGRPLERFGGGFPVHRPELDFDPERQERIGDMPSTFSDEETRRFLREVTEATAAVQASDPRPLYVIGDVEALAALGDAGPVIAEAAVRINHGGLAEGPGEALRKVLNDAARARDREQITAVLGDLDEARGRKSFAGGVDEVWQSVTEGRAALVAIEDDFRATVRDDGEHLVPAGSDERGAREDIVDEIAEQALDTGARVHFVPDGMLENSGHIAAVLRY
ncbi:baeRF3 domain-containing protein [Actinacidiphila acididurans]|uniref:Chemotaxis protein n=1 Tax=Actinacidiphila acididurans TaxID=2784346 RepID=A0ABS2U5T3_9ACTN|nr:chemotaxis protein [Actinacidiphila acididurans]MBM9509513.1 chemotaxis protein [Actinacidiphila acididurans]